MTKAWYFEKLIHNSDMYLRNFFVLPDSRSLELSPLYDMLLMPYASLRGGEALEPEQATL